MSRKGKKGAKKKSRQLNSSFKNWIPKKEFEIKSDSMKKYKVKMRMLSPVFTEITAKNEEEAEQIILDRMQNNTNEFEYDDDREPLLQISMIEEV